MLGLGFIKSFTKKMYASSFQFSIDKPKESPNSTGFLPKTCGGFLDGGSLSWLWAREARSCHLSLLPSTARVSNALSTWEQDMCRWILHSSLLTQHDRQHHENQEQSSVSQIWANSEKPTTTTTTTTTTTRTTTRSVPVSIPGQNSSRNYFEGKKGTFFYWAEWKVPTLSIS